MQSVQKTQRLAMSAVTAAILLAALILVLGPIAAKKPLYALQENAERSVQGRVVDDAEKPLRSAIVYLSDQRTMTVQSYITQEDGAYRFQQLSPNDDYKLWAQLDDNKSKSKLLSSYDGRSVFHVILKIAPKK